MNSFIKLTATWSNGKCLYLNPSHITSISDALSDEGRYTLIELVGGCDACVEETAQEIFDLIDYQNE